MANFIGHPITQTAAVAGVVPDAINSGSLYHAVQVLRTGTNTFSITVEGSLDGVNFDVIATVTADKKITQFSGVYKAIQFNVGTIGAGNTFQLVYVGR